MTVSPSALDLMTLLRRKGVGPRAAVKLLEKAAGSSRVDGESAADRKAAEQMADECQSLGIGVVGWFDPSFPRRLREIPDPPAVLFFRGDVAVANEPRSVAIVGTRTPTSSGQSTAYAVSDRFASEKWTIVSGLALGIDTIAHERAVAHSAPTIAVLGNGLSTIYPAPNRALGERIVGSGGLLLAEVPPHARVDPRALVRRDRLQSGLAALTVVCQGGRSSGAMHTARFAIEQGRPLYVPVLPRGDEPFGEDDEGTQALLNEPVSRLAALLPPWRSALKKSTTGSVPAAAPLDESVLDSLHQLESETPPTRYEPPTLF